MEKREEKKTQKYGEGKGEEVRPEERRESEGGTRRRGDKRGRVWMKKEVEWVVLTPWVRSCVLIHQSNLSWMESS